MNPTVPISDAPPQSGGARETPISPGFALRAVWFEKYVLPWVSAFLASQKAHEVYADCRRYLWVSRLRSIGVSEARLFFAGEMKNVLIFAMLSFTCVVLLINQRPSKLPDKLKHLVVPIAMSYYFVLYGIQQHLPRDLVGNLLPPSWQFPAAVAAAGASIAGYGLVIWAMLHLRRSFSVFVSVREIVSGGPYSYVRHPIYAGYLLDLAGLFLATCSIAMFILCAGFFVLVIVRARIEEEKLMESSEAYRGYAARTGFLLPIMR